jgi:hypothetical protein
MHALILLALAAGLVVTTALPVPAGYAHTQRVARATTFARCPGTLIEYHFEYSSHGSGWHQHISLSCLSSNVERPWRAYWVLQSLTGCYHDDAENDGCNTHGWTRQLREHALYQGQEKPTQRYRMIRYALGRNCRAVQWRKDPPARSWSCKRYSFFAGDKAGALPNAWKTVTTETRGAAFSSEVDEENLPVHFHNLASWRYGCIVLKDKGRATPKRCPNEDDDVRRERSRQNNLNDPFMQRSLEHRRQYDEAPAPFGNPNLKGSLPGTLPADARPYEDPWTGPTLAPKRR